MKKLSSKLHSLKARNFRRIPSLYFAYSMCDYSGTLSTPPRKTLDPPLTIITNTETASNEATPGSYTADPETSGCGIYILPPPYSAVCSYIIDTLQGGVNSTLQSAVEICSIEASEDEVYFCVACFALEEARALLYRRWRRQTPHSYRLLPNKSSGE